jgi:hypothetical protein
MTTPNPTDCCLAPGQVCAEAYAGSAAQGSGLTVWGSLSNATGNTPSTYALANLDDADDKTNELRLTNFGFSIPSGATIDGITVTFYSDGSADVDLTLGRLTKDGSAGVGNNGAANEGWGSTAIVLGGVADLWGTTWTRDEINASTFGIILQGEAQEIDAEAQARRVKIEVCYTPA